MAVKELILSYSRAPGDAIVLTSLVRDLKRKFGEQLQLDVRTPWPEVFANNPYLTKLNTKHANTVELVIRPWIKESGRGRKLHFVKAIHEALKKQTGIDCPVFEPKPDLHFSNFELEPLVDGDYWVMLAGGKSNITVKHWYHSNYQRVVDKLLDRGLRVVQLGIANHQHAQLRDVQNMIGQTNIRQMLRIIRDAKGVICPVTAAMHAAAALEKPCVVIAGGREEPWWEWYGGYPEAFGPEAGPVRVPHRFLHTLDQLPCCMGRGCWKKLVIGADGDACHRPNYENPLQPLADCMAKISSETVIAAVDSYGSEPMTGHSSEQHGPAPLDISNIPRQPYVSPTRDALADLARRGLVAPRPTYVNPDVPQLDHPLLGGRITIATILYGDYYSLHVRLLDSLFRSLPQHRVNLLVGMNEVCPETKAYLAAATPADMRVFTFDNPTNDMKYPVMRKMLRDQIPLSQYLVWFDDDSYVVQPNWLEVLAETIIASHPAGYRLYGIPFKHTLRTPQEANWFRSASWYRGRPFLDNSGRETPNGDKLFFASGGFWAGHWPTLLAADVPDERLGMHGGDITIGAQIQQHGGKIKAFNLHKSHIFSSGAPPRGLSKPPNEKPLPWRQP